MYSEFVKKNKTLLNPSDIAALISAMKIVFPTREDLGKMIDEKLTEKIRFVPTKELFLARMDKLSGEIKAYRDEQTLHQGQHEEIVERVQKVEKKLNIPFSIS